MNDRTDQPPALAADDPRISEWLDGRLSPAEAAAIEREVGRSPTLSALVADLRAIKDAARGVGAAVPPADFTDRVLAAIATGGGQPETDRVVADEWQAIETARIAEERAEAVADREDAAHEPAPGQRWPWLALAGALAAGLLVTVVLNRPRDGERDVALAQRQLPAQRLEPGRSARREGAADALQPATRERTLAPPAPVVAARDEAFSAAAAPVAGAPAEPLAEAEAAATRGDGEQPLGEPRAKRMATDAQALETDVVAGPSAAAGPSPIEVVVWGGEGRAALMRQIEALGLVARPAKAADRAASRQADAVAEEDLLEIVGSPEAIASLLAEVAGWEEADREAESEKARGGAGAVSDREKVPGDGGRVVIRIVEARRPAEGEVEP